MKGKALDMKASEVYQRNADASSRFVVNEGGTRSTKTVSLCQLFITRAYNRRTKPGVSSIVRKTLSALKGSAMRDFFWLLETHGLYNEANHNKTDNIYRIGKQEIEFFSLDEPQKVRGRKRRDLFINEANELTKEDFVQLKIRTTGQIYLDYNPSEVEHWIYDEVIPAKDTKGNSICTLIKSTYLDNPFLEQEIIDEIERLKTQDESYWKIYGLGERSVPHAIIFTNWTTCTSIPGGGEEFYGLDFGYNHPTALVREVYRDGEIWEEEKLYQSGLTNLDLIQKLHSLVGRGCPIYADGAEPDRIEEIRRAGFNIKAADKGPESVKNSIDHVKRFKCHILESSTNLIKEIKRYKWRTDKNDPEKVLAPEQPVPFMDDLMAARRYAIYSHLGGINSRTTTADLKRADIIPSVSRMTTVGY